MLEYFIRILENKSCKKMKDYFFFSVIFYSRVVDRLVYILRVYVFYFEFYRNSVLKNMRCY